MAPKPKGGGKPASKGAPSAATDKRPKPGNGPQQSQDRTAKGRGKAGKKEQYFDERKQEYAEQSKKEKEARHRAQTRAAQQEKYSFYRQKAEEKKNQRPFLENAVTYVQDKLGKPKPVSDLNAHWVDKKEVNLVAFVPSDFYIEEEDLEDQTSAAQKRVGELEYFFEEQGRMLFTLRQLPHHQFWSHVVYNKTVVGSLRSFVAFCTRVHEERQLLFHNNSSGAASPGSLETKKPPSSPVLKCEVVSHSSKNTSAAVPVPRPQPFGPVTSQRLDDARFACYEHVFWLLIRITRTSESATERIGSEKFADLTKDIWSFPFLLDFCSVYGTQNFDLVFQSVRSVLGGNLTEKFSNRYEKSKKAFTELLQMSLDKASNEGNRDAWLFLADCLQQLECVFSFFPPDFNLLETDTSGPTAEKKAVGSGPSESKTQDPVLSVYKDLYVKASAEEEPFAAKNPSDSLSAVLEMVRKRVQKVIMRYCQSRCCLKGGVRSFERLEAWVCSFADDINLEGLLTPDWADVLNEWHGEKDVDRDRTTIDELSTFFLSFRAMSSFLFLTRPQLLFRSLFPRGLRHGRAQEGNSSRMAAMVGGYGFVDCFTAWPRSGSDGVPRWSWCQRKTNRHGSSAPGSASASPASGGHHGLVSWLPYRESYFQ